MAAGAVVTGRRFGSVLLRRARRIGDRRAVQAARRLGDAISAELGGVTVQVERTGVRLTGRGLFRRWITDARLRWLGRLLR